MKTILVMVMSVDGKTTQWFNPLIYKWTSKEDQNYFFSLIKHCKVIVMGRKTFIAVKSRINLSPQRLRIVVTKNPKSYEKLSKTGQLEFTDDAPTNIITGLQKQGYDKILLAGGEEINGLFLKEKCVNEIWITVEPFLFGNGNGLVGNNNFKINLQLLSIKKLNKKGTLLLKYLVL